MFEVVDWCSAIRLASSPTRKPGASRNSCSAHSCAPVTPLWRSIHWEWRCAVRIRIRKRCRTDRGLAGATGFFTFCCVSAIRVSLELYLRKQ